MMVMSIAGLVDDNDGVDAATTTVVQNKKWKLK